MKNEDTALYNRYRPESFDDIVGNESTIASIKSILAKKNKSHVFMFTGPYGTGKCVTKDTFIITENGINEIGDYSDNTLGFIKKEIPILSEKGMDITSHFFEEEAKNTIKIKNDLGLTIQGTEEHPILILDKDGCIIFKQLKDIQIGDYTCIKRNNNIFSSDSKEIYYSNFCKKMDKNSILLKNIPKTLNTDLSRLMGYIVANASHSKIFKFSTGNHEIKKDIENILNSIGQKLGKPQNLINYPLGGIHLSNFILKIMELDSFPTARYKTIPKIILNNKKENQINFIRGLFDCDSYCNKGLFIEYSTASSKLANQIQILLLNLGIISIKKPVYKKEYNHTYYKIFIYGDNVDKYIDIIGSIKYPNIQKIKRNTNKDIIPFLKSKLIHLVSVFKKDLNINKGGHFKLNGINNRSTIGYATNSNMKAQVTYSWLKNFKYDIEKMGIVHSALENMKTIIDYYLEDEYYYSKIINKDVIKEPIKVCDFAVPKSHAFFSNGFISHNTTMATVIAKELGCSNFNLMEVDAGSDRSVDDMDRIKETIQFKPMDGNCRVIIINEIQTASSKAMQSLLDTTEKTPKHTYFIFTTTDPHKINKGLMTRSIVFNLTNLTVEELSKIIKRVLIKEKVKISENVIEKIAENADGSARTALTMLEQVIGLKNESDMLEVVERFTVNEKEVIELCRALLNKKSWMEIITILKGIKDEPERVRLAVVGYCDSVLLNPKTPQEKKSGNAQASLIIECFVEKPFYSAGKAMLTNACFQVICG